MTFIITLHKTSDELVINRPQYKICGKNPLIILKKILHLPLLNTYSNFKTYTDFFIHFFK